MSGLKQYLTEKKKQLFGHLQEGLITRSGHYERVDWMLGVPHTGYHYM